MTSAAAAAAAGSRQQAPNFPASFDSSLQCRLPSSIHPGSRRAGAPFRRTNPSGPRVLSPASKPASLARVLSDGGALTLVVPSSVSTSPVHHPRVGSLGEGSKDRTTPDLVAGGRVGASGNWWGRREHLPDLPAWLDSFRATGASTGRAFRGARAARLHEPRVQVPGAGAMEVVEGSRSFRGRGERPTDWLAEPSDDPATFRKGCQKPVQADD
jgi:hypothetical protein